MQPSPALHTLKPGQRIGLGRVHPTGSLIARREAAGGVKLSWRYDQDGKDAYEAIGYWDEKANPNSITPTGAGFSVKAALRAAEQFALAHYQMADEGGFAHVKAVSLESQKQARLAATTANLGALMDDYVQWLKDEDKKSWRDVQSAVNVHIKTAQPHLAAMPARSITSYEVAEVLRAMVGKGLGPHSVKVRAHLNAAFDKAMKAPFTPSTPAKFREYNIEVNPVARVPKETKFLKSAKDPLSLDELRLYWAALNKSDLDEAYMLRLHVLLGGPRIEQLAALLNSNVRDDLVILKDGKGRGGPAPRDHILPLTPLAKKQLARVRLNDATYALCVTAGKSVHPTHLSRTAQKLVGTTIDKFLLKRVRSGVETVLAAHGVNKEIRGRLQSHGIGGVQDINYNAHEYIEEKRAALELLENLINNTKTNP